ncbi:MAG: phosphonate ABC transporter, permease protein PhnE [Acidimicrobiia bacterium]
MSAATVTTKQARPVEPPRARSYILPLFGGIFAAGATGLLGEIPLAWGALVGLVIFGTFWLTGFTRQPLYAVLLVAAGIAGLAIFDAALASRTGSITFGLALIAGTGWLLPGAAAGYVVLRERPGLRPGAFFLSSLAWFGGAVAAIQAATVIGYLDTLNIFDVQAGALQQLTTGFFVAVGLTAAAIGLGVNFSQWMGKAVLGAMTGSLVFTVIAVNAIGFSTSEIATQLGRVGELAADFWPPQWEWPKSLGQPPSNVIVEPFIETLQIAVIGATFGCLVALPLAFSAARPTARSGWIYWLAKGIMNTIRTIPDVFWAVLFAAAVGFGSPFAGALAMFMFSISIMAKLLSETVDAIDVGPLEAANAAGASHEQMVQYGAFPQVLPNYVAYALYVFELNIRASVVIGIVGAGGVGQLLDQQRSLFQWDRVMAIVIVIFVAVLAIEGLAVWLRRQFV